MTTLARAVPLTEPDHVTKAVADDLHLDMARSRQVALEVDLVPAEAGEGLALRAEEGLGRILGAPDDLHAPAAAAVGGFDRHWPTDRLSELRRASSQRR